MSFKLGKESRGVKNSQSTPIFRKNLPDGVLGMANSYGDDYIRHNGKTYPRKDGKIKHNGKWSKEGSHSFPWEKDAMKAE